MNTRSPIVSVCLPVYNGENYLRTSIKSVLEQTFEEFELIISDNASTDSTEQICRVALNQDARVRYYRESINRGLAWNFNRLFALAKGRYLVWIGHDDIMGRDYLSQCVGALEMDSEAVLCYTNSNYIDNDGNLIRRVNMNNPGAAIRPGERYHDILHDGMCDPICGIMKSDHLKQTRLYRPYADHDRVLLAEMGLRGRFLLIPEYIFSRRMHTEQSTQKYKDLRERTLFFDPTRTGKVFFPLVEEVLDLFSAVFRTRLPFRERLRCCNYLLWWLETHGHLRNDLYQGLVLLMRRYELGMLKKSIKRLKELCRFRRRGDTQLA